MSTPTLIAIIASLASVGMLLVAWQALGSQRRKDQAEMTETARRRDDAIMAELRSVREGQVRLETLWSERDRSALDRRRDWVREASEVARAISVDVVREHAAGCPGRGSGGGTNPRLRVYSPEHDTFEDVGSR